MAAGTATSSGSTATASAYRPGWKSFSQATRTWFSDAFPTGPTAVQERAWAAIGRGENALVIAPTGSGKTLAAFLSAIDRLGRLDTGEAEARERPESAGGVRVSDAVDCGEEVSSLRVKTRLSCAWVMMVFPRRGLLGIVN